MQLAAASVRAAEFEVSRSYPLSAMEEHISKMLLAANEQHYGILAGGSARDHQLRL